MFDSVQASGGCFQALPPLQTPWKSLPPCSWQDLGFRLAVILALSEMHPSALVTGHTGRVPSIGRGGTLLCNNHESHHVKVLLINGSAQWPLCGSLNGAGTSASRNKNPAPLSGQSVGKDVCKPVC